MPNFNDPHDQVRYSSVQLNHNEIKYILYLINSVSLANREIYDQFPLFSKLISVIDPNGDRTDMSPKKMIEFSQRLSIDEHGMINIDEKDEE